MFPNLKAEMARKAISITGMADRLKMSRHTLRNKLSGKTGFSLDEVQKIKSIFFPTHSLEYLFSQDDQKTAQDETCATSA